ncbi:beta strand repeat-containing protein [Chloroflexota bacterium]
MKILLSFLLFVSIFGVFTSPTSVFATGLSISFRTPVINALDIIKTSNIEVQFNTAINGTSITKNTFNVDGSISGKVSGIYSGGGTANITFNPTLDFKAGETVTVTLTTGIQDVNSATLTNPVTWQFVIAAPQGYANFEDSGQSLGNSNSSVISLGDVDSDGDLDAFVTNLGQANKVWQNDGSGNFEDSGQALGVSVSRSVILGDVNGDGDLDAFVVNNGANRVMLNDGSGNLSDNGQLLGGSDSYGLSLGDVDGDGDLDAFVTNYTSEANRVWLNDGSGNFTDSGQFLGSSNSIGIALGDVDSDGDLDAFVVNDSQANKVWLNNGSGNFSDSLQALGSSASTSIMLGDVDGDGDLDAFVANGSNQANTVWLNNGSGIYSGQSLGSSNSNGIVLGDVDGDGDLDAFVTNGSEQANKVWLNNGSGNFSDSGLALGGSDSTGVYLGDVDGDGDLDAFVNNYNQGNKVWLNVPLLLTVSSKAPADNTLDVIKTSNIEIEFNTSINGTTVNENTFNVDGSISGKIVGNYSVDGTANITFDPDSDFKAGETITITLTTSIHGKNTATLASPVTWQFVVDAPQGYANFEDSGQSLGSAQESDIAPGDIDGDGDLDAFVANYWEGNTVWLNDGSGNFSNSGQLLGSSASYDISLGDVDDDGDLDAFVANEAEADKVWLNDGTGNFTDNGQSLDGSYTMDITLGDVDGDGDLDAFVANGTNQANMVWLNDGSGNFSDSGLSLGSSTSLKVALGDVDGDGDLDAFIANLNSGNKVWLNDGSGNFTDSGQSLGSSYTRDINLGDVDGDGDLDAFVANRTSVNKVWLNDGNGSFTDSGQSLGNSASFSFSLGDVDGDGDLDAFVVNLNQADKVWLNDGTGNFTDSGQSLVSSDSRRVSLGDVDGDGDLDAFIAHYVFQANKVWLNVPVLVDIAVSPTDLSLPIGRTQQFSAIGTYSDNSTANITDNVSWTSSNPIATINTSGLVRSLALGQTIIVATSGNISGNTTLTVTPSVVEINSGDTLKLIMGEIVTGNATAGIQVGVKDLPDLGAPVNGVAAFQFDFNWDKDVIHIDSATQSQETSEWYIETGTPDNANGTVSIAGFTTTYSTDDIILFYLGIHAVGSGGDSTSINITITSLFDKNNVTIIATSANASVTIITPVAETSLTEGLSSNVADVVVVKVNIDRIKDPSDNSTANITGGIGSYTATISSAPGGGIEILDVHGMLPSDNLTFDNVTGIFTVTTVVSPFQADTTTVAEIVVRLIGSTATSHDLTVTFNSIGAAGEPGLNVPEEQPNSMAFRRGDTDGSGTIDIGDASWIAQNVVFIRTLAQMNAINAASVSHGDEDGDKIDIGDASWVAQYVVFIRDAYFE